MLSVDLAVRLWARARELQEEGDLAAARDVALDATVVWAIERASLEEDVLLELLEDVWGAEAGSILGSARRSSALTAWRLGAVFDQVYLLDDELYDSEDDEAEGALDSLVEIAVDDVWRRRGRPS